ncbi:MAG: class I SAM-dependent methyltransferase [Acidobacteria bacterium]|nr:class I SAM-dependent methyltransferase [Acidobacteriota bacterium]
MIRPKDPLAGSAWSTPGTVAGFAESPPNANLVAFANRDLRIGHTRALDIGCGAGRNSLPLAHLGWQVVGLDLSWPMLCAARQRTIDSQLADRVRLALAPMDALPVRSASCDFVVAHGIWNLACSAAQFRASVREAARVARTGAGLFVFTFSRNTLPADAEPVPGESFVFTQFSGEPQCFLTKSQLVSELEAAGFTSESSVPLAEHNLPRPGQLTTGAPVIYEAAFRRVT